MPGMSRNLVIDASVARSAGGVDATATTSVQCRDFLLSVLRVCHHLAMTAAMSSEWKRNQSSFTRNWQVQMANRRKLDYVDALEMPALRERVEATARNDRDRRAMLKDWHLIEAALATHQVVVSRDESARCLFDAAARELRELRSLAWVNPEREDEHPIAWLKQGARSQRSRRLGRTLPDV